MLLLLCLWLLFLPNAPYMITDLVHLTYLKSTMPVHFDVLLNVFTVLTALMSGFLSLYLIQEMMEDKFSRPISWILTVMLLFLCSIGVFLGRFLRWNSWDLFNNPLKIFQDIALITGQKDSLLFIGAFMLFISFTYFIFYSIICFRKR